MTRNRLLLTTAICSAVMLGVPVTSMAAVTTTTTTTHTYDFPGGTPSVSSSSTTLEDCRVYYNDSSSDSSNDDRRTGGGWVDTDGDGRGDTWSGNADSGSYRSSDSRGGRVDGQTNVSNSGRVSGSHNDGYEGRSSGSSDSGSDSSSRVICTHFYQKGELSEMAYFADIDFTRKHLPDAMVRGYHVWGIWYVEQMRKNPGGLMERIMRPIALHRANEIAYKMGVGEGPDVFGKLCRAVLEPFCLALGLFAGEQDWKRLYAAGDFKAFSEGYRRYQHYKLARTMRLIDPRPSHVLDVRNYRQAWI